jgi:hypothetical protein
MQEPIITTEEQLVDALSRISLVNTVLDFKWKFEYLSMKTLYRNNNVVAYAGGVPIYENEGTRPGWLVWVSFERPDTQTGKIGRGRGRDEIVWEGTALSGVVKTAYVLIELMVRHELMEGFRFDDARIFNPHNSVLDLAELQHKYDLYDKDGHKLFQGRKYSWTWELAGMIYELGLNRESTMQLWEDHAGKCEEAYLENVKKYREKHNA